MIIVDLALMIILIIIIIENVHFTLLAFSFH